MMTLQKLRIFARPLVLLGSALEKGNILKELEEYTWGMYSNSRFTSVEERRNLMGNQ